MAYGEQMTSTLTTALSTLLNACLLGRRYETLSARCWRCRDGRFFGGLRLVIDALFFWQDGHCESIYRLETELGIQGFGDRMAGKSSPGSD